MAHAAGRTELGIIGLEVSAMTLLGLKKRLWLFSVNHLYAGTHSFEKKRRLLRKLGYEIGEGTKVVGPVFCTGSLTVGKNCWVGKNFMVNGNGSVTIGDNCDIAPEVAFQTGGHEIGSKERRAGEGLVKHIKVGNGCWIGARSTILGDVQIGDGSVVAACACVCKDVESDTLVGGVPAREIKKLSHD